MLKFIRRLLGDRPHREEWYTTYGIFSDHVGSVWLARDQAHADRQRKLDASQNVMTRLL